MNSALLFFSASCLAAGAPYAIAQDDAGKTEIRQEISIKGGAKERPPAAVPAPRADKAVVDEVIRSLDVYKGEQKQSADLEVPLSSKRLGRLFPEAPYLVFSPEAVKAPYDRWIFEVLSGGEVLWRTEGDTRIREPLEWDGSGSSGETVVRVGRAYRFRFTGKNGPARFTITSQPVVLKSLSFREYLGETHLEVAASTLFTEGKPGFSAEAGDYLKTLEDRVRRVPSAGKPYRFMLYSTKPKEELSRRRADKMRDYFAKRLLINPRRVEVDVVTAGDRGEVAVCVLPAERGAALKNE